MVGWLSVGAESYIVDVSMVGTGRTVRYICHSGTSRFRCKQLSLAGESHPYIDYIHGIKS